MKPIEAEQSLLAHIVQYGNTAARICLPQLTPEKFVFSTDGSSFGGGHSIIWTAVRNAYLIDNLSPTLEVLKSYISGVQYDYLQSLPVINHFDPVFVEQLSHLIDKQGLVYNVSKYGYQLGSAINDTEMFMQTVSSIPDIELWVTDKLNRLRSNTSIQSEGYEHIAVVANRVKQRWEDLRSGKITAYVDSGLPSLRLNNLFGAGEVAIIHGLQGSGKSSFVFQVQLGTALGLYVNDLPGCVAINSLEMTAENLVERVAGMLARINLETLKSGNLSDTDYARLLDMLEFAKQLPIFVDDTNFLTTSAMQYRATGLHVSEHGPVVQISSDYGELFKDEDSKLSKEQRVDKVFREQFNLSRTIGASVLAISQSTIDQSVSGRTYIAGPDATRYSRGATQSADIVCEMYNPVQIEEAGRQIVLGDNSKLEKTHPYLLVQKKRSGAVGKNIPFGWIPEHTVFFDMSIGQTPGKEILFTTFDAAMKKWNGNTGAW